MKRALIAVTSMIIMGIALTGCPGPKSSQVTTATGTVDGYIYGKIFNERTATGLTQRVLEATVSDDSEPPEGYVAIQGAVVSSTGCLKTTTTDSHGYFVLDQVAVGTQQITATKDGYNKVTFNVTVVSEMVSTSSPASIAPTVGGSLTVNSTPIGASIFIDNIDTNYITPHTFNPVITGTHTLYVTKIGYDTPESRQVIINEDSMTDVKFLLFESEAIYLDIKIRSESLLGTWLIYTGTTQQFVADCLFSDGSSEACTSAATWTSSNETVGSVGEHSGLFQAKTAGYTTITVALDGDEVSGQSDTVNVTVIQSVLESITVTPSSNVTVAAGYQQQFTAKCRQTDGTETFCTSDVSWTSTDNSKGTIDSTTGLFTGVLEGSTEVFASWQGKVSNSVPINISAPKLESISITPPAVSISAGLNSQFVANCSYSNNTTSSCTNNVTWTSNNISVATIGANSGLITGVAKGDTTVFASWQSVDSNLANVTITDPILQSISITPPSATVFAFYTQDFVASCIYSDGSELDCTGQVYWLSSNTDKGTIDSASGIFTGVSAGTTYITASLQGKTSNQATITVKNTATVSGFAYIAGTSLPISGVRVNITVGDTTLFDFTDGTGYFEIDKVPTGSVTVIATKTGYDEFEQTVSNVISPETAVDVYMTQQLSPVTVSGTVTDSSTSDPITGVLASILDSDGIALGYTAYTNASGYYEINGVPPSQSGLQILFTVAGYTDSQLLLGTLVADKTQDASLTPQ